MEISAIAKQVKASPRKMRLLVDMVRGKKVDEALNILKFTPSPAARILAKAVKSAAANAENNFQMNPSELKIVRAFANKGITLKRFRAKPRGRVGRILKRYCHITVVVDEET